MASYGYTFQSGDGVTPTRLNAARTVSDIVNADIASAAAIDKTKIAGTAITAADTGTVTSAMIADETIVNADINASAAIAGTKIAPDFGSQDVKTTGRSLVGISSARTNVTEVNSPQVQVEGTDYNTSSALIARNSANNVGTHLVLAKSRSATALGNTAVQSGDTLGNIQWQGADGTNLVIAAQILSQVDGTPGTNDMPGRLIFSTTADGASSPNERMRIDSTGRIIANSATPNTTVAGSIITDGRIQSDASFSSTTSNAANLHILTTGLLARSTSSARYKTNIETAQKEYSEAAVYTSRPVWFRSTCQDDRNDWSHWGFIAEEVAEIDPRLVAWGPDENGTLRPEGVQYDRFVPHLCAVVKDQRDKIAALEARIAALEAA